MNRSKLSKKRRKIMDSIILYVTTLMAARHRAYFSQLVAVDVSRFVVVAVGSEACPGPKCPGLSRPGPAAGQPLQSAPSRECGHTSVTNTSRDA